MRCGADCAGRRARVPHGAMACPRCAAPPLSGRRRCGCRRIATGAARRNGVLAISRMSMLTEKISQRYVELDSWASGEMIAAMYESQLAAAAAVRGALPAIAAAVDDAVPALQRGGRIVYVGARTSRRICVQDGAEPPPTYQWPAGPPAFPPPR